MSDLMEMCWKGMDVKEMQDREVVEVGEKERKLLMAEREMIHRQLELLAERSEDVNCGPTELAALSEQMVAIYSVLAVCSH